MGRKAHIICAKCGSDEMHFEIDQDPTDVNNEDGCGVFLVCENCAELTGIEEWNEDLFADIE